MCEPPAVREIIVFFFLPDEAFPIISLFIDRPLLQSHQQKASYPKLQCWFGAILIHAVLIASVFAYSYSYSATRLPFSSTRSFRTLKKHHGPSACKGILSDPSLVSVFGIDDAFATDHQLCRRRFMKKAKEPLRMQEEDWKSCVKIALGHKG